MLIMAMLGISSADSASARDLFKQEELAVVQPGGTFTATLPGYGTQAVKFTSKSRVVCDEALWYDSSVVRTTPHYLRTYVQLDCAEGEHISQVSDFTCFDCLLVLTRAMNCRWTMRRIAPLVPALPY